MMQLAMPASPDLPVDAPPAKDRRRVRLAAFAVLAVSALFALPGRAAEDFPPPISAPATDEAGAVRAAPASSAPVAVLPAPSASDAPSPVTEPAGAGRPAVKPQRDVQIEQKHIGRRVSEVVVTPAGFTYQYTMVNLEGQDSGSVLQPHPGLSIPRFFRFDF